MNDSLLAALYAWHRARGFNQRTALRLALWCIDGSPAPGWTHKDIHYVQ